MTKANKELIRVALVDDHILLRDALASVINTFEGFEVSHLAENGQDLIDKLSKGQFPDVIILDLNMPRMDGYETAKWLHINYPSVVLLVLTMYDTEVALIRLLNAGVKGFVKKDVHPHELKQALQAVAKDGYYYSQDTSLRLIGLFRKDDANMRGLESALLSDTEIEFLKLSCTDLTYREIADKMSCSARAIDGYRDALFEKLDVKSRVGLVVFAIRHGIVTI
jgi:two-component system, NarL family, invasion response regulator UvrY